jgi:hypothetical protein
LSAARRPLRSRIAPGNKFQRRQYVAVGPRTVKRLSMPFGGGRTWWAHFEFTRINIEPIILRKKIEDFYEARA